MTCDPPQLQIQVSLVDLCKCLPKKSCIKNIYPQIYFFYFNLFLQMKHNFQETLAPTSIHGNSYKFGTKLLLENSVMVLQLLLMAVPESQNLLFNFIFYKKKKKLASEQDHRREREREKFLKNFCLLSRDVGRLTFIYFLKKILKKCFWEYFFFKFKCGF